MRALPVQLGEAPALRRAVEDQSRTMSTKSLESTLPESIMARIFSFLTRFDGYTMLPLVAKSFRRICGAMFRAKQWPKVLMVTLSSMNVVKMFTVTVSYESVGREGASESTRTGQAYGRICNHRVCLSSFNRQTCLAVSREYLFVSQYKVWGVVVMRWSAELQTFEYAYTIPYRIIINTTTRVEKMLLGRLFIAAHEEQSRHGNYCIPTPNPTGLVWVSSLAGTRRDGHDDDKKTADDIYPLLNRPSAIAFIGDFMFVTSFLTKEMAAAIGETAASPDNPQRCIVKIPTRDVLKNWKRLGKQRFSPWGLTALDNSGHGKEGGAVLCATSHRGLLVAMIDPNNGKILSRWDEKVHVDLLNSTPSANVILAA
eukprot:jgi/Bigna1/79450/fgenesh1_pg.62_\